MARDGNYTRDQTLIWSALDMVSNNSLLLAALTTLLGERAEENELSFNFLWFIDEGNTRAFDFLAGLLLND